MADSKHTGIIVLAAGSSSRLGQPKQLLPYGDTTLLQHAIRVATGAVANSVMVVLGSHADQIREAIERDKAQIVINKHWQEGMASSIRYGINMLVSDYPQTDGVILMLCDQPYVDAALLNSLTATHADTSKAIVASSYNGVVGVPAFFHKSVFPRLLVLTGETGARLIIQQYTGEVATVAFSQGNVDIDTAADYEALRNI